jgi:hypothetical protein
MLQSTSLVFPLHDHLSIAECCYSFRLLYLHLSLFMEPKSSVLLVLVVPSTSVFWYIRCHKFWDWCISCPGKDSSCQVGPGVPPAQLLKSVPLDISGHKCWSIKNLPIFLSPVKLSRWNTSCCFTPTCGWNHTILWELYCGISFVRQSILWPTLLKVLLARFIQISKT